MNSFEEVYLNNKRLDDIFMEKYEKCEPQLFEKNCLEFLTELGEFANESKCFKYWSIKKPKKDEMLEEFADCITMALYFFNYLDLELKDLPKPLENKDILLQFDYLFKQCSKLMLDCNEVLVKDIYVNLLHLGLLFELTETEIIEAIRLKHNKIEERLNSDY